MTTRRDFIKSAAALAATLTVGGTVLSACKKNDKSNPIESQGYPIITSDSTYRYIKTSGLPNHSTGTFPNANCPFKISEVIDTYRVPLVPTIATTPTRTGNYVFGIGLNGVVFDPGGPFWNRDASTDWEFDPSFDLISGLFGVDSSNGHTMPTNPFSNDGLYHYHGLPVGLINLYNSMNTMSLVGYAADGYPIYNQFGLVNPNELNSGFKKVASSYRLKSGPRQTSEPQGNYTGHFYRDYEFVEGLGDLDQFNGRFGVTKEYPSGIYHYYLGETFPKIPFLIKGIPDDSFINVPGNASAELPFELRNWPIQG